MFKKFVCNNECEAYLDNLFNSLEEGILISKIIYDDSGEVLDFTFLEVNKVFEKVFGISRENIIGKTISEAYSSIAPKWIGIYRQIAKLGRSAHSDIHFEIADMHFKVNVVSPAKGQIIAFFNDITDQLKADEVLKKHFVLFENAHDILLYLKSDGSIIDANKTALDKYGYSYIELINMNIQQLRCPSMVVHYKEQMEISASKGIVFEGIHVRKDGTSFPVEVSSRSIDVNGELLRIHIIRDITERKEAEEKIKYLANYDALTGIANRGFLMRQFENILELSARGNLKFAVMLFDVDKFKSINDVYGHNAGDEVLRKVAQRLQETVRKSDIVGRLGGDEFLVIQTLIDDQEESSALAHRILNFVCKPVQVSGIDIDLRISLGAAIYPEASREMEGLIHCADIAMYAVKQKGGNSYNIYSDK
jgi:diguanylate cyclase (GGDEF)-like protein/PAS domain S-box-containing protein